MPGRGLEPPHLAVPVPKTGVSTISPPRHMCKTLCSRTRCPTPGAPSRSRTCDHLLKRELLYQLSYGRSNVEYRKFLTIFQSIYDNVDSVRPSSQVVRHGSAKASSAVRFRPRPPEQFVFIITVRHAQVVEWYTRRT